MYDKMGKADIANQAALDYKRGAFQRPTRAGTQPPATAYRSKPTGPELVFPEALKAKPNPDKDEDNGEETAMTPKTVSEAVQSDVTAVLEPGPKTEEQKV